MAKLSNLADALKNNQLEYLIVKPNAENIEDIIQFSGCSDVKEEMFYYRGGDSYMMPTGRGRSIEVPHECQAGGALLKNNKGEIWFIEKDVFDLFFPRLVL